MTADIDYMTADIDYMTIWQNYMKISLKMIIKKPAKDSTTDSGLKKLSKLARVSQH